MHPNLCFNNSQTCPRASARTCRPLSFKGGAPGLVTASLRKMERTKKDPQQSSHLTLLHLCSSHLPVCPCSPPSSATIRHPHSPPRLLYLLLCCICLQAFVSTGHVTLPDGSFSLLPSDGELCTGRTCPPFLPLFPWNPAHSLPLRRGSVSM